MKSFFKIILFLGSVFASQFVQAEDLSPVGYWKTIDDNTKEPRAIVEIFLKDEKAYGKIIKTFPKPDDKPICDKCPGDKKDTPIVGLEIIWDLEKKGDVWKNGEILDPENGKTYSAKIEVRDEGKKLKVRGYIGISFLGRTQYWEKADKPEQTDLNFKSKICKTSGLY